MAVRMAGAMAAHREPDRDSPRNPSLGASQMAQLGDGQLSFNMALRLAHRGAQLKRKPMRKGVVLVEKLVNVATSPLYGPQVDPDSDPDPVSERWAEARDADYASRRQVTRKSAELMARTGEDGNDREFLTMCFELLDGDGDDKLTSTELEHWIGLLLQYSTGSEASRSMAARIYEGNEDATLSAAERKDVQRKLGKEKELWSKARMDWQDFLVITLDFYILVGEGGMHRTFAQLLSAADLEHPQQQPERNAPRMPRAPVKPRSPTLARVQHAGSWEEHLRAAEETRGAERAPARLARKPLLPLPPVSADVLGPPRTQPLRPVRPTAESCPPFGRDMPKRQVRAVRSRRPVGADPTAVDASAGAAGDQRAAGPGQGGAGAGVAKPKWTIGSVQEGAIAKQLADRVEEGMLPESFRRLARASARPARRVTEKMPLGQSDAPTEAPRAGGGTVADHQDEPCGWRNNLPVMIVPGLCSSGLVVQKSDKRPDWVGERVWFSLEKLSSQRGVVKAVSKGLDVVTGGVGVVAGVAGAVGGAVQDLVKGSEELDLTKNAIRFHLHRARGLAASDTNGESDPEVTVQLLDEKGETLDEIESSTKHNTRSPFYDEDLVVGTHIDLDAVRTVRVLVEDYDSLSKNEFLGEVLIPMPANLSSRTGQEVVERQWFALDDKRRHAHSGPLGSLRRLRNVSTDIGAAMVAVSAQSGSHRVLKRMVVSGEVECWLEIVPPNWDKSGFVEQLAEKATADFREAKNATQDALNQGRETIGDAVSEHRSRVMTSAASNIDGMLERVSSTKGTPQDSPGTKQRQATKNVLDKSALKSLDKKQWLRHMSLAEDGKSDPEGIAVRAVQGIEGVDYLQTGAMGTATTWVFGHIISHLRERGYDDSNLRAAPYDWRMCPAFLEKRDQYFTKMCKAIEGMSADNQDLPIVLVAHSMGNNMAHYFLNWVQKNGDKLRDMPGAGFAQNGQAWLDRYIHGLLGISGSYLGATKPVRATICGEDFGMGPALLSGDDAVLLCRGMGSGSWLLPKDRLETEGMRLYERVEGSPPGSVSLGRESHGMHRTTSDIHRVDSGAHRKYLPLSVKDAICSRGAEHVVRQREQWYDQDPCIPGGSSANPPPIKRMFHVYGINLDTETGYAFKGDGSNELDSSVSGKANGYLHKGGIIHETEDTSQMAFDPTLCAQGTAAPTVSRRCSGDGTVPYMSMQHTASWNSPSMLSQVVELEKAEHREILSDERLHRVLADYLCDTLVVYVLAARNLAAKDLISRSSDPYAIVTLHSGSFPSQRRTRTHNKSLNPTFDEVFTFGACQGAGTGTGDVLSNARVVSIEVRDSDFGGLSSDEIGTLVMPFSTILESPTRAVNGWFKLMPMETAGLDDLERKAEHLHNGEIFVHFELESAGQSFRGVPHHMERINEIKRENDIEVEPGAKLDRHISSTYAKGSREGRVSFHANA